MNFEFLVNVPLLLQNLYRFLYILMEVLPFLRIIHKIFRADLSRHVVVADHVIGFKSNSTQKYAQRFTSV